jgi:hypothetical protein
MKVWLLTTGSGKDGDEWHLESVHDSERSAKIAKAKYEEPRYRKDGSLYKLDAQIEEHEVKGEVI